MMDAVAATLLLVISFTAAGAGAESPQVDKNLARNQCNWNLLQKERETLAKIACCKIPDLKKEKLDDKKNLQFLQCLYSKTIKKDVSRSRDQVVPSPDTGGECLAECYFEAAGLLNADNKLDEKSIENKSKGIVEKNSDWKPIYARALKTCFQRASSNINPNFQCKSGAGKFSRCMMRELYMKCPLSSWNNSEGCKKEKEMMIKCPNNTPPPVPQ